MCSVKEDPFLARVVLCDLLKPTFVLSFESDRFGAKIIGDMLLSSINWSQCIGRVSNFESASSLTLGMLQEIVKLTVQLIAHFTSIRGKSQVCDL